MMRYISTVAIALLVYTGMAGQSVQRLSATKANDYGLVYTLPNTALDVTIEVEIEQKQPGEFYKYATKYLNVSDPIMKPERSVRLKSVTINTSGVPNPDHRYLVTLKSNQAPYIILNSDNIPLSINTEKTYSVSSDPVPEAVEAQPTPLEGDASRRVITQEMLQSHSSAKRAQLAAEQIYTLRQSRTDIITGQADQMPPDGAAMQLVLDNINAQEDALLAMFVGTTSKYTQVKTFKIVPDGAISGSIVARVSPIEGIVAADNLSGAPVVLSLKVVREGELPVNEKGEMLPFPKGGVAYCIPGEAQVNVEYKGKSVAEKTVQMAQFGVVYGMNPSNFTDKKAPVYLLFNPATGAAAEVGPAM